MSAPLGKKPNKQKDKKVQTQSRAEGPIIQVGHPQLSQNNKILQLLNIEIPWSILFIWRKPCAII